MATDRPLISVLVPTYNHARHVAIAIESVLRQTIENIEVVVVDDGSTDDTAAVLDRFTDPRIVRIHQPNSGPSAAINRAVEASRGQYVAQMSGDDVCFPDRLERQLACYQRGPRRLLFSTAEFIDEDGRPVVLDEAFRSVFVTDLRTQAQFIRRFFDRGNCVNAVTAFTEREVYAARRFHSGLYQSQDFNMWVHLIKQVPIEVDPAPTVHYRVGGRTAHLSALTPGKYLRIMTESLITMRGFFEGMSDELFRAAFGDRLRRPDYTTPLERACEEALLFFGSALPTCKVIGVERLFALLNDPASAPTLAAYGYDAPKFARTLLDVDPLNLLQGMRSHLYVDTGEGFNHTDVLSLPAYFPRNEFTFTFDTSAFPSVRALRWDPLEGQLCRVKVEEVVWQDRAGSRHHLDPALAQPNIGRVLADGFYEFATVDPWFTLPIKGEVVSVTVAGTWHVEPGAVSLNRTTTALQRATAELAQATAELSSTAAQLSSATTQLDSRTAELTSVTADLARLELLLNQRLPLPLVPAAEELPADTPRPGPVPIQARIADLEAHLLGLDQLVHQRERELLQRQAELAETERQLADRQAQLDAILNSRRWKIVTRLRNIWRRLTGRAA